MTQSNTKPGPANVDAFLNKVADPKKRDDAQAVRALMERVTGEPATMWGASIVGFGSYHYRYDSGREGDAPRVGFSPRASALVLYVMDGFPRHQALLDRLGKHSTGKACLYIKKLADVDQAVLEELVTASLAHMDEAYPAPEAQKR